MPELPEVETVRRGLLPHLHGQRIRSVTVRDARLRWPVPANLAKHLSGRTVTAIDRRGKYLIVMLDSADRVIVHLGMSGRVTIVSTDTPIRKHDHIDWLLESGQVMRYHDPRRFGAMLLWPARETSHVLLDNMGPEPFTDEFNGEYLFERSRGKSVAVKNFVMDGQIVVGAGNIYATEALFRSGIRPTRAAQRLSRAECLRLVATIRDVLSEAIVQGGTTLKDFAGADGKSGYFQQKLYAYGRDGEPCLDCGTTIKRLVIGQRASFYCTRCQK